MGEPPLRGSLWTQGPSGGSAVPWGAAWCFVHASKSSVHGRTSSEWVSPASRPWWGLSSAQGLSVVLRTHEEELSSWQNLL